MQEVTDDQFNLDLVYADAPGVISTPQIYDNIVNTWRAGEEKSLYNVILVKADGTVTLLPPSMEPTFNPYGSEDSLRDFLSTYVR